MTAPAAEPDAPPRPGWLRDAERVDLAIYAAIARTPTPALDNAMRRLTRTADYSQLSLGAAALMAVAGGRRGRRAALSGLASVGVTACGRQPRPEAPRGPPAARPRRRPCSSGATREDADLDFVPLGPLGDRIRLCERGRSSVPACLDTPSRSRRARRLLARPHRRSLPRRRRRRGACRDHSRPADSVCARPLTSRS